MLRKMYYWRLDEAYRKARKLPFNPAENYVFISDLHRGDGSDTDDFVKNRDIYMHALKAYGAQRFTYIEGGDGDELWKSSFKQVYTAHREVYELIARQFIARGKYHYIWGNHDEMWKKKVFLRRLLLPFYKKLGIDPRRLNITEAIKFKVELEGLKKQTIFVCHGHQGEIINDWLWWLNLLINRYIWKPLQKLGVKDFVTSPARNHTLRDRAENRYYRWAKKKKIVFIAGHTHRPMFESLGKDERVRGIPPHFNGKKTGVYYFNTGSGVHANGITTLEIGRTNVLGGADGESICEDACEFRLCLWQRDPSGAISKRILERASIREVFEQLQPTHKKQLAAVPITRAA